MSEINYFKVFIQRWCGLVTYGRYKLVNEVIVGDVDSLHVKRITLNDW
jgi:hypothetical protein